MTPVEADLPRGPYCREAGSTRRWHGCCRLITSRTRRNAPEMFYFAGFQWLFTPSSPRMRAAGGQDDDRTLLRTDGPAQRHDWGL
jgi:hypothetical protein